MIATPVNIHFAGRSLVFKLNVDTVGPRKLHKNKPKRSNENEIILFTLNGSFIVHTLCTSFCRQGIRKRYAILVCPLLLL